MKEFSIIIYAEALNLPALSGRTRTRIGLEYEACSSPTADIYVHLFELHNIFLHVDNFHQIYQIFRLLPNPKDCG